MATPNTPADATNSIIALLMDELRQSLEPKLLHALADYHLYKETHNAVLQIPFVKHLLETQCKCRANQTQLPQSVDPIQLEIIDVVTEHNHALPNLDSIAEYINTTISHDDYDADDASETGHHAVEPEESDNDEKEGNENEKEAEEEEEAEAEEEEEAEAEEEEEEEEAEEEEEEEEEEEAVQEAETSKEDEEEAVQDEEEAVQDEEEAVQDEEEEVQDEEEEDEVQEEEEVEAEEEEVQEEVEVVEAEEEEEVEKDEVQDAEEEEEELELFEVEIKGKTYVTNDETDGDIYAYVNDEVGEIVGTFKNGVAKFAKKAKSKST